MALFHYILNFGFALSLTSSIVLAKGGGGPANGVAPARGVQTSPAATVPVLPAAKVIPITPGKSEIKAAPQTELLPSGVPRDVNPFQNIVRNGLDKLAPLLPSLLKACMPQKTPSKDDKAKAAGSQGGGPGGTAGPGGPSGNGPNSAKGNGPNGGPKFADFDGGTPGGKSLLTAAEIECLLEKVAVPANIRQETAKNYEKALSKMNLPENELDITSLLHHFAMIKGESGAGEVMTEKNMPNPDKRGYGYMQVTGPDNLKAAESCMREYDPSIPEGIADNPEGTLGNGAQDKYPAALASLCWWRDNIGRNPKHVPYSRQESSEANRVIHQIANSGRIGGPVTDKTENRREWFQQLVQAKPTCIKNANPPLVSEIRHRAASPILSALLVYFGFSNFADARDPKAENTAIERSQQLPQWHEIASSKNVRCTVKLPCDIKMGAKNFKMVLNEVQKGGLKSIDSIEFKSGSQSQIFKLDEVNYIKASDGFEVSSVKYVKENVEAIAVLAFYAAKEGASYHYIFYDSKRSEFVLSNGTFPKLVPTTEPMVFKTFVLGTKYKLGSDFKILELK